MMSPKFFILLFLAFLGMVNGQKMKELREKLDSYNRDVRCWGKKNTWGYLKSIEEAYEKCYQAPSVSYTMPQPLPVFQQVQFPVRLMQPFQPIQTLQYPNVITHSLGKRHTEDEKDQQELAKFLTDWSDLRDDLTSNIGNTTCVLKELDVLTPDNKINIDTYTNIWDAVDLSDTLAGEDKEFRDMLTTGYTDCHDASNAMPVSALLNLNPLVKDIQLARNLIFFQCAKKVERRCCMAAELYDLLTTVYGEDDGSVDWTQFGFPENKYEQALISSWVLDESKEPVKQFIDEFFDNGPEI